MKLRVGEHGVYLDDTRVPATHVHIDLDARKRLAHVQVVLAVPTEDLDVDLLNATVRTVYDDTDPRHIPDERGELERRGARLHPDPERS